RTRPRGAPVGSAPPRRHVACGIRPPSAPRPVPPGRRRALRRRRTERGDSPPWSCATAARPSPSPRGRARARGRSAIPSSHRPCSLRRSRPRARASRPAGRGTRSEEHTSELQSLRHLVCRLLLEKKKKKKKTKKNKNKEIIHSQ